MKDEKDIVDKEIERVKDEKAKAQTEAEAKIVREGYIKKQRKKEQRINLYFPELEQTGTLNILFSPIEHPLSRGVGEGEFPPKTDEWAVVVSIGKAQSKFFSEYSPANYYFFELFRKHNLEKNRIAYIDNDIAEQEDYKENSWKKIRKGIIALGVGIIISGIGGTIIAVLSKDFGLGITMGVLFIVMTVMCVWNLLFTGINDTRIHKKRIEQLKSKKDMSSGPW